MIWLGIAITVIVLVIILLKKINTIDSNLISLILIVIIAVILIAYGTETIHKRQLDEIRRKLPIGKRVEVQVDYYRIDNTARNNLSKLNRTLVELQSTTSKVEIIRHSEKDLTCDIYLNDGNKKSVEADMTLYNWHIIFLE